MSATDFDAVLRKINEVYREEFRWVVLIYKGRKFTLTGDYAISNKGRVVSYKFYAIRKLQDSPSRTLSTPHRKGLPRSVAVATSRLVLATFPEIIRMYKGRMPYLASSQ